MHKSLGERERERERKRKPNPAGRIPEVVPPGNKDLHLVNQLLADLHNMLAEADYQKPKHSRLPSATKSINEKVYLITSHQGKQSSLVSVQSAEWHPVIK